MHGVHGKPALPLVAVATKRGTEQRIQLNMVVLIALNNQMTCRAATPTSAQVINNENQI